MHDLNPKLREELERRGIEFAPLLTLENWNKIVETIPTQNILEFKELYRGFNGFIHPDHKSQMKLWTIQDIIATNKENMTYKFASSVIIGDVIIESNYIVYDIKSSSIVIDGYDDRRFLSIPDMLEFLTKGYFDVI